MDNACLTSNTEKTILSDFRGWKKEIWAHKKLIIISLIFYGIAAIIYSIAGRYVDKLTATAAAPDLILDNIPTINLGPLFTYGFTIILLLMVIYPLFFKTKELHIVFSHLSLLILVRSFFVILTHLRAPSGPVFSNFPQVYQWLLFDNDLFFSGHTAVPFLGFLLFRKEKIGLFFLVATFVMAVTVLLMHVHYSIDVFAAVFIAYGTYRFGKWLFRRIIE